MPDASAPDRRFFIFSLQGSLYALDLDHVAEVSDPPRLWPIPQAPPCYAGAINFHGDIIAVLNFADFIGLPGDKQPGKIIILNSKLASLALLVDAISGIFPETEASISPPPESPFAASLLSLPGKEAILLDIEALVRQAGLEMHKKVV